MAHLNQQNFIWQVKEKFPKFFSDVKVLDIGSLDVNGNNKIFFNHPFFYVGVDLQEGKNVDAVSPGHLYDSGFQFDTVISTECFEHDMYWARTLQNMVKVLRSGGLLAFTCASTDRPEHGTLRTSPENAPLLEGMNEEWANYYRNLSEKDIRSVLNVTEIFSDFEFREDYSGYIGNDLYFWGIKK
jgi:SAM-dependent methyltransferase